MKVVYILCCVAVVCMGSPVKIPQPQLSEDGGEDESLVAELLREIMQPGERGGSDDDDDDINKETQKPVENQSSGKGKFQGDIVLTGAQKKDIDEIKKGTSKRGVFKLVNRWPRNIVFYKFDPNIAADAKQAALGGMRHWEANTCVRFRLADVNTKHYVIFQSKDGDCNSKLGLTGGAQLLNLGPGCRTIGIAAHEIAHSIGFMHEHSRPDRDEYVTVHLENVKAGYEANFDKIPVGKVTGSEQGYDVASLLHYGPTDFSATGKDTITPKVGSTRSLMGQRDGLSQGDILLAKKELNCGIFATAGEENPAACNSLTDVIPPQQNVCQPKAEDGFCFKDAMKYYCKKTCCLVHYLS